MDMFGTKLGYAEYCTIPEDGLRHEVIDGVHFVNPAPTPRHQSVSSALNALLWQAIDSPGLGRVMASPLDVELADHDIVQPDIVVVLEDNMDVITKSRIVGAPDLVVEILSASTEKHDRERKFALYEKSGVREYCVVDTADRVVLQQALVDGRYELIANAREKLRLHVLPEVEIELARVWA